MQWKIKTRRKRKRTRTTNSKNKEEGIAITFSLIGDKGEIRMATLFKAGLRKERIKERKREKDSEKGNPPKR